MVCGFRRLFDNDSIRAATRCRTGAGPLDGNGSGAPDQLTMWILNALCSAGRMVLAIGTAKGMPFSLFVKTTKPSLLEAETIAKLRKPGLLPHCQRYGPPTSRSIPQPRPQSSPRLELVAL